MIDYNQWLVSLMVLTRITAFLMVAPFFSNRGLPPWSKIGLGFAVALLVSPFIKTTLVLSELSTFSFALMIGAEALFGLALGALANLIFASIMVGGQLVDIQIGFGMSSLIDPTSEINATLLGQFFNMTAILMLLVINGHHSLLMALVKSYELVPLGGIHFYPAVIKQVTGIFVGMFVLAIKIVAPIIAVLIISDLSLGLVARTVPQLNVFILGFPLKIGLGLMVLAIIMPILATVFISIINQMEQDLLTVMGGFR